MQGLEDIHKEGIIHKDIKPKNVLFDDDGYIQICDFGVSKLKADSRYGGTLCYMALEVVKNKPNDFQADFYSLGVLMYKMITGNVPYNCKERKEMIKLMNEK